VLFELQADINAGFASTTYSSMAKQFFGHRTAFVVSRERRPWIDRDATRGRPGGLERSCTENTRDRRHALDRNGHARIGGRTLRPFSRLALATVGRGSDFSQAWLTTPWSGMFGSPE